MLAQRFETLVGTTLIPRTSFRPYPTADDRTAWERLPEPLRRTQVDVGESYLGFSWPALPATLFMEYARNGNRRNFERASFARRGALEGLITAECVEGSGRFIDDIVNGIWAICEESFWGVPAHNDVHGLPGAPLPDTADPIIDLFAAETGALLAFAHYLLKSRLDGVSELIADRIVRETKARIIDPFLERDDFWWMGLVGDRWVNNWNPWCTSNCLTALLLLEQDEERRRRGVAKSLRILDAFLNVYPPDGGCDEGTTYWGRAGGSLFDCLELLFLATGGAIDVFHEPLIAEIGRYMVRMHISGDYFVNFADGNATLQGGESALLLFRYAKRIGDPRLEALGVARHRMHPEATLRTRGSLLRKIPGLFTYEQLDNTQAAAPFIRDSWLPHTQVMAAREREGTDQGLFLAAKGGHNAESHNHNDVGSFIAYLNGNPILIDAGVGTYSKQTFSADRYKIWTMRSNYHNLPTVGGAEQQPGPSYRATGVSYDSNDDRAALSLDITSAYPPDAGISRWSRTMELRRGERPAINVIDDFQLEQDQEIVWTLMTPKRADIDAAGTIRFEGGAALTYDPELVTASQERIEIDDERLGAVWGESVYRILLKTNKPARSGRLAVTLIEKPS